MLRCGRAGAPPESWIHEALEELKEQEGVDRAGAWLEALSREEESNRGPVLFRGEVWESGESSLPRGWSQLSIEVPLPVEALSAGKSVEYDLEKENRGAIFGPMVGLQRMVWVPVMARGILRGLMLVGTREKKALLERGGAERVAGELGLLLEWQEEHQRAGTMRADLELWRQLEGGDSGEDVNNTLGRLARSCTEEGELGTGAVFALIGERRSGSSMKNSSNALEEERLVIRAQSGDPTWAQDLAHGPLEKFWRQAGQSGHVVGAEPGRLPLAKEISRIVAIPMGHDGERRGVMLAGIPRGKTTLEVLGRLELRAMLAGQALERDRRKGMESRRESWQKALLESSEEPVVLVDRDGFLQGMSRGAKELIQSAGKIHSGGEMTRLEEIFRPREWERVNEWVKSSAGGEGRGEKTLESELGNGAKVRLKKVPLSDGRFLAVGLSAGENQKKSRPAENVEEELLQALEWLEEGIVVFDEQDKIRAKNAKFLRILGLSEEEGRELKNLEDVIQRTARNAPDAQRFAANWRALREIGEEGIQEELAIEKPVRRVIDRYAHRIVGEYGNRLGRVEVYQETTARRVFESRMVQTEKLVALGQRVGGIVHELGSPLTTILGNAQRLLARHSEGGQLGAETQQILDEAERATTILRQLLNLSSETQAERRLVSMNELLKRTVELQRTMISRSGLKLEMELQEKLPPVVGDFGQLQQVLLNLLQNAQQAIEHSGQGSTIGVRTARTSWGRVQLEVWDDGPGIPPAIQSRIFDPFFTTKAAGVGTGLGLAIVQGFVRQHGGTVTLLSSPPRGARFVVELPAHEEVRVEQGPMGGGLRGPELIGEPAGREIKVRGAAGAAPRILVVEDEPTVGRLIADVLRDEGMRVEVLRSGESALRRVEEETYDLVICDLKMPGMDGQIFYRELRQRKNKLSEKVLFVTGDLISPRTQAFLRRYQLPRVAKPFRVEELSEAVRILLERSPKATVMRGALAAEGAIGNG